MAFARDEIFNCMRDSFCNICPSIFFFFFWHLYVKQQNNQLFSRNVSNVADRPCCTESFVSGTKLVWHQEEKSTLAHVGFNKHSEVEVVSNHSSTPHCVCKIILFLRSELPSRLLLLWDRELFIISNCDTGSKIMRTTYLDSA